MHACAYAGWNVSCDPLLLRWCLTYWLNISKYKCGENDLRQLFFVPVSIKALSINQLVLTCAVQVQAERRGPVMEGPRQRRAINYAQVRKMLLLWCLNGVLKYG